MTMSVGAGEGRRMTSPTPISRCEFGVLLLICLLGFGFRAWDVSSVGIDHFDEGVYALSGLSLIDPESDLYFKQTEYSPPLFFTLVGLSYSIAGQASGEAAIAVNVVLGALTIPLLWWVGRIWFGAPAGIFAAALLAFSEYHITLSRTALTDVAFAFFLLLALAAIVAALRRHGLGLSLLAGVAVGLAWNTKYHGWLALVMTGIALVAVTIREPLWLPTVKRSLFLWSVIVVVAVACYLPWAAFVQAQPGGYLGVVENHRSLLSLHWPQNFWVHAQDQFFLDGPLSRSSILAGFFSALLISGRFLRPTGKAWAVVGFLATSALLLGGSGSAFVLALLAVPALLGNRHSLAAGTLAAWLGLLFLLTPFYHPYARLLLPFTIATCLGAGVWVSRAIDGLQNGARSLALPTVLTAMAATLGFATFASLIPDISDPWRPSRSVAEAVSEMQTTITPGDTVFVLGAPSVAFHLRLAGRLAEPIDGPSRLEGLRGPAYVVTGVYAKRNPHTREVLKSMDDRLFRLETFPLDPKDIRILDDFSAVEARRFRANPDSAYALTLYRLVPSENASIETHLSP